MGQATGARDPAATGPMASLRRYRSRGGQVHFGIYLVPLNPGASVRVGDSVAFEA